MLEIVFIHGLGGDEKKTWGNFPVLLGKEFQYEDEVKTHFYSYPSGFMGLRIPVFNKVNSPIQDLSEALNTFIDYKIAKDSHLLIVAHSLGGLVARQYIIDRIKEGFHQPTLAGLIMYATPNTGAELASAGKHIPVFSGSHLKQLSRNSDVIESINKEWVYLELDQVINVKYLWGALDKVVSKDSARLQWGNKNWVTIPGKGHTDIVKPEDDEDISYLILTREIDTVLFGSGEEELRTYSKELIDQLASVKKKIEKLTTDQYSIIRSLKGRNRALIKGCAGSGKTLIAAEKSIRLDKAGIKTLLLCSSPLLCSYLREMLSETSVDVYSFTSWVEEIIGNTPPVNDSVISSAFWNYHSEPTEKDLNLALEMLTIKYSAIIVDEGQDFKDESWIVIESALADENSGTLYIFADDNQSLIPSLGEYPVEDTGLVLNRNCRNSGEIFKIVKKFHPEAPDVSSFLEHEGHYIETRCPTHKLLSEFQTAVRSALSSFSKDEIVIITTETSGLDKSDLSQLDIPTDMEWDWEKAVTHSLKKIKRLMVHHFDDCVQELKSKKVNHNKKSSLLLKEGLTELNLHKSHLEGLLLPEFSKGPKPSENDFNLVRTFMKNLTNSFNIEVDGSGKKIKWVWRWEKLLLVKQDFKRKAKRNRDIGNYKEGINKSWGVSITKASLDDSIQLYLYEDWLKALPQVNEVTVVPYFNYEKSNKNQLSLYDPVSFKGLESDCVIVYVKNVRDRLDSNLYVAISRARFYGHLIIEDRTRFQSKRL